MSRIKVYNTHTEIINGLFIDIPDEEFTFLPENLNIIPRVQRQYIEEAVNHVFRPREQDYRIHIDPSTAQELERFEENLERHRERNRIENERLWSQIRNMSEEELINHFDRISQEEEN